MEGSKDVILSGDKTVRIQDIDGGRATYNEAKSGYEGGR